MICHPDASDQFGVVDHVFGHAAVGRPFAARDGEQPRI
jgi:hypothetical protein